MTVLNISNTVADQVVSDQTTIMPFAGVTIADDPSQTENVTVTLSDAANGTLTNLGDVGTYDAGSGIYTDTGSATSVTADLQGLVFTPAQGVAGQGVTTGFTLSDTDSALMSATDSTTSVIAVAGPAISGTTAGQVVSDTGTIMPFTSVTISDDPSQTETIAVTLSAMANGTLNNSGNGIYDPTTGIYTDTGSVAAVNADLENLVFTPAQGVPGQSITTGFILSDTDTASLTAIDGTTSVIAYGGPAINGATAGQVVSDTGTITPFANVTLADDPSQTETLTVTLSNTANGTLNNSGTGIYDPSTGIYTDTGSAALVTADLQGVVFTPAQGPAGQGVTTSFTISDSDTASLTATDSVTSVIAVGGPAIIGTEAGQAITDQTTITPFVNVAIADDGSQSENVTVTLSDPTSGTLSNLAITASYDPSNGLYTDSGSAAAVTTDLDQLVFTPTEGVPGQSVTTGFVITATDTASITATDSVTSVIATGGPAIIGTAAGQTMTDQGTIAPFANVAITDDNGYTETVTVTLSSDATGTLSNLGGFILDGGVYTDTGSAAKVTADLKGLLFAPVEGTPGQAVTTGFTITDNDSALVSATDTVTSVIATGGPSISGTLADQAITDPASITPFANVRITDDSGQIETVTITLSDPSTGTLTNLGSNGSYDSGVYTDSGSAAAVTADLDGLVFTPAQAAPGLSVTTSFTINDIDTAQVSISDAVTSVIATSPSDAAPVINGTVAGQLIGDTATITPFTGVTITDDPNQIESVTVTLSGPNGTLSNSGGFTYDGTTGSYVDSGSATTVTADLEGLVFTPAVGVPGQSVTTNFVITATDTASITATDLATSVIAIGGPAISGTTSGQMLTDTASITPFAGVTITDDSSQTETVTVTLSDPANGILSNDGGNYNSTTGVYTDTGLAAAVTADLEGLVFTPAPGTAGQGVTTGFTISDTDTALITTTDTVTSVIAVAGPTITGTTAGQMVTDTGSIAPFANVAITDDSSQTETVTVTLSNATNGILSNGSGIYNSTTGVYTDTGSAAAVTADLDGLQFTPAPGTAGQGVTTGFTISDTDTALIPAIDTVTSVIAVAGPDITGTTAGQEVNDTASIAPFTNVAITDDISQTETLTVTLSDKENGSLSTMAGGHYDPTTGVFSDTGSAAVVTADLKGLVFNPTPLLPGQSATSTFTISDTDTASILATDTVTSVITVAGPAIAGTMAGQTVTDTGTIAPFANVTITDAIGQTETVTVTPSDVANGSLGNWGNGHYDPATGVYTDTGSATAVTADLDGLQFTPAPGTAGQGVTTGFTISDTDTALIPATNTVTSVIAVAGPDITGTTAGQIATDTGTIAPFANVTITDDISQTETVTVTLSDSQNGSLGNWGNGHYDSISGIYSDTGSATAVTADLHSLQFTPMPGTAGQGVTTGFTISDTDTASIPATDAVTSVIAVAGPAIGGTQTDQLVADTGSLTPFANVVISDDPSQSETVTVKLLSKANGSLSNLGSGHYNAETGIYTDTGSAADVTADLNQLVFTPVQGTPGQSVTTAFKISDTDTALFSASNTATSVIAIAGPAITGTEPGQWVTDTGTITPFANVAITDDSSQTETVTVKLSSKADGSLRNLGSGHYNAATGRYTDTGSAAAVTADLQGLVFMPAEGVPGQGVTTGFSISDTDSASILATDTTTSVIAVAGPTITGTMAGQSVTDTGSLTPFANVVISDDPSQAEQVTVTLSDTVNGDLTNLGGGHYDSTTGVYTDTGSAAAVTADLAGLVFTPTPNQVAAGQSVTTTFAISDTDSVALNIADSTTSVIATASAASLRVINAFSGGSTSDVLFTNTDGNIALWTVQNGVATAASGLGALSDGWSIAGAGHFYGTGTSDILFQNTDGDVAQWQMQNGVPVAATTVGATDPTQWSIVGTGDFYGNGTDGVLFRNTTTGTIAQWQVQDGQAVAATTVGATTSDWTIAAIGKLNTGAGADNILFISNNGGVADWTVANGVAVAANSLGQTSSYWSIAGIGDFTGNGQNDILFRGQGDEIAMWQMQNGQVVGAEGIGQTSADWQIVGTGDYNGDGTSDILFRNTNGTLAAWEMQNGHVANVSSVGATTSDWHVAT